MLEIADGYGRSKVAARAEIDLAPLLAALPRAMEGVMRDEECGEYARVRDVTPTLEPGRVLLAGFVDWKRRTCVMDITVSETVQFRIALTPYTRPKEVGLDARVLWAQAVGWAGGLTRTEQGANLARDLAQQALDNAIDPRELRFFIPHEFNRYEAMFDSVELQPGARPRLVLSGSLTVPPRELEEMREKLRRELEAK